MKIFYLGANIHQEALDIIEDSTDSLVIYERNDIGLVQSSIDRLDALGRAFALDKKDVLSSRKLNQLVTEERERIISVVLNDYRFFLLRARFKRFDYEGAFSGLCYFSDVVDYALSFHYKYKPQLVYCSYTPHTLEAWIFMRTLEATGVRIIRLISSPLPWILQPVVGLSTNGKKACFSNQRASYSEKLERYLLILKGSYEVAKPYYERVSRIFMLRLMISFALIWRPRILFEALEKRLVYREYKRSVLPFDIGSSFAVYFLHYQPEMNTIPEAGLYCDQYQAIKKLAEALPEGIKLIVKEHPSTFTKRCDRRWRPHGFYQRISELANTQICPHDIETYQVIDNSKLVASIAGVCLTEALARGTPVVSFFSPRFNGFGNDLVIDASSASLTELKRALEILSTKENTMFVQKAESCLKEVVRHGYDGSNGESYIPQTQEQAATNSKKANYYAVQDIINGKLV